MDHLLVLCPFGGYISTILIISILIVIGIAIAIIVLFLLRLLSLLFVGVFVVVVVRIIIITCNFITSGICPVFIIVWCFEPFWVNVEAPTKTI